MLSMEVFDALDIESERANPDLDTSHGRMIA